MDWLSSLGLLAAVYISLYSGHVSFCVYLDSLSPPGACLIPDDVGSRAFAIAGETALLSFVFVFMYIDEEISSTQYP